MPHQFTESRFEVAINLVGVVMSVEGGSLAGAIPGMSGMMKVTLFHCHILPTVKYGVSLL